MAATALRSKKTEKAGVSKTALSLIAWEGIGAQMPESWNLVAASGDASAGYYRVDGPESEIVEFRWRKLRSQPDLESIAEDYLKQVKKSTRKQKNIYEGDIFGSRRRARSSKTRSRMTQVRFEWLSDRQALGKLLWCGECKRVVIAQISFPPGKVERQQAEAMLESVHDHTLDGGVEWGLYGLSFRVPSSVKLIRQQLMSGFLSLNFKGRAGRVIIERWGLAEVLLSDGMQAWHRNEYLGTLSSFRGETDPVDWGEHEALQTQGREGGLQGLRLLYRAFFMPWRVERFASLVWHCPQTNRIVGVRAFGIRPLDLVHSVAATVRCHEG